jgi:hypothetical protein
MLLLHKQFMKTDKMHLRTSESSKAMVNHSFKKRYMTD